MVCLYHSVTVVNIWASYTEFSYSEVNIYCGINCSVSQILDLILSIFSYLGSLV